MSKEGMLTEGSELTLLELDQGKEQNAGIVKHAKGPQSSAGYLCVNRGA